MVFNCLNPLYNINITVLLQDATTSQEDSDSAKQVRFLLLICGGVREPLDLCSMIGFNFLDLFCNINITVLLQQNATALSSREDSDSAKLVSKILNIELWRRKRTSRSVFSNGF